MRAKKRERKIKKLLLSSYILTEGQTKKNKINGDFIDPRMELTQDIKITCQNSIIKGAGAQTFDGHPLRNWKIKLVAVDNGKEKKGRLSELLDHVEYILHPTFTDPRRGKYIIYIIYML